MTSERLHNILRETMVLFLFIHLLSLNVSHAKVSFDTTNDGNFVLLANRCEELNQEVTALKFWYEKAEGRPCNVSSQPKLNDDKAQCFQFVGQCVPDHAKKYHGAHPEIDGPNCWNLSLVMAGLNKYLRYSSPAEMKLLMGPPLCRLIDKNEKPAPGDIIAIRNDSKEEVHGAIFISENLVYSKNGVDKNSPYAIQPLESMMDGYKVPKNHSCRSWTSKYKDCEIKTNIYKCWKFDKYLEWVQREEKYQEDVSFIRKLEKTECSLSNYAMMGTPISPDNLKQITEVIEGLKKYGQTEIAKRAWMKDEKKAFHLSLLKRRLEAMTDQLEVIYDQQKPDAVFEKNKTADLATLFTSASEQLKTSEMDSEGK